MTEQHKAVIKQETRRTIYVFHADFHWNGTPHVLEFSENVAWNDIWSGTIDRPPFEKGSEIFINELDIFVTIEKIIRTTSGEYWYYIADGLLISDEKTQKRLKEAQLSQREYFDELNRKREFKERKIKEMTDDYFQNASWFLKVFDKLFRNWPYGGKIQFPEGYLENEYKKENVK